MPASRGYLLGPMVPGGGPLDGAAGSRDSDVSEAIGSEPGDFGIDSARHWQNAMCGHAAANIMPVVASNRIGSERAMHNESLEMTFYGSCFIADNAGVKVAEANRTDEAVLVHAFDLESVGAYRKTWGVFRDRRPDLYGALGTLDGRVAPTRPSFSSRP